jgi:threonine synthase
MWARAGLLPVGMDDVPTDGEQRPVSLGEGSTPLLDLGGLLADSGPNRSVPGNTVLFKDERANPTGSFKDRLYSAALTRAREVGASTVALASSGNAGLSAAAYAAAAGLDCTVLSTSDIPRPTVAGLESLGARLLVTDTDADRWRALTTGIEELGWYPLTNYRTPPVASNVFGLHGYRTIAYEIADELGGKAPDWMVVPVSRGDALYGIWAGFAELLELGLVDRVPRLLAVERFPSLTGALEHDREQPEAVEGTEPVQAHSIGSRQGTHMALRALRDSGGFALACDDVELWRAWRRFARAGLLIELASAAALVGLDALRERELLTDATAVLLGTGNAFTQATLPPTGELTRIADPTDPAELG